MNLLLKTLYIALSISLLVAVAPSETKPLLASNQLNSPAVPNTADGKIFRAHS